MGRAPATFLKWPGDMVSPSRVGNTELHSQIGSTLPLASCSAGTPTLCAHEDNKHAIVGWLWLRERTLFSRVSVEGPCNPPPPCSPSRVSSSLAARSCKGNISDTRAFPSPSACTHPRASAWQRTLTTCGMRTFSSSPTPNQVRPAWARGRNGEGRSPQTFAGSTVLGTAHYLPATGRLQRPGQPLSPPGLQLSPQTSPVSSIPPH